MSNEEYADLLDSLIKTSDEFADVVGSDFTDVSSGLSEEKSKEELAEKFGESVGKELIDGDFSNDLKSTLEERDERYNPDLDELMNGPVSVPESKPEGDLRSNPDLEELFGETPKQSSDSILSNLLDVWLDSPEQQAADENPIDSPGFLEDLIDGLTSVSTQQSSDASLPDLNAIPVQRDVNNSNTNNPYQEENDAYSSLIDGLNDAFDNLKSTLLDLGELNWRNVPSSMAQDTDESEQYGPFLPDLPDKDSGVLPIPLDMGGIGGGLLEELLGRLSESIDALSESINTLAGTMEPKKDKSDKEIEEEEYREKEYTSVFDAFGSGFRHNINDQSEESRKAPANWMKSVGERMGTGAGKAEGMAEFLGAGEGLSAFAAGIGGAVAGVGLFIGGIKGAAESLSDWNESLMRSNFQFATYSAAMANAEAQMEAREIAYSTARGDARADSANELAESFSELKTAFAPIADFFANTLNKILTVLNKILSWIFQWFNKPEESRDGVSRDIIGSMEDEARSFLATFGAPTRFVFGR